MKKHFQFDSINVLLVGAGGFGCENLKSLSMSGFKQIHVVDFDTIELSNLNHQFLFKIGDIGKSKSVCACEVVQKRIPSIQLTPHCCAIQDFNDQFFLQFQVVIAGLDSVETRIYLSNRLCDLKKIYFFSPVLVDGGAELWAGSVKIIKPCESPCMECQKDFFSQEEIYNYCTITDCPRKPIHCVIWAKEIC
jgi:ubiquitin-activating enzyme E1 C